MKAVIIRSSSWLWVPLAHHDLYVPLWRLISISQTEKDRRLKCWNIQRRAKLEIFGFLWISVSRFTASKWQRCASIGWMILPQDKSPWPSSLTTKRSLHSSPRFIEKPNQPINLVNFCCSPVSPFLNKLASMILHINCPHLTYAGQAHHGRC